MKTPPSPHFAPVDLTPYFNAARDKWGCENGDDKFRGLQGIQGIPFLFGDRSGPDLLALNPGDPPTLIALSPITATYLIFVHTVADRAAYVPQGFGSIGPQSVYDTDHGNELGDLVSTYTLKYSDGSEVDVPVLRRLEIQQRHISWGASPFGAIPALGPTVDSNHRDDFLLGRAPSRGRDSEMRGRSGRVVGQEHENLWLYALPNPHLEKPIIGLRLRAETEQSHLYAISTTSLAEHPLRLRTRRKLRMRLPDGVNLNALGELDTDSRGDQIGIDLGTVISARAVLEYPNSDWTSSLTDVQPIRSEREVIVEYTAHPDARLYVRTEGGDLVTQELRSIEVADHSSGGLAAVAIEPAKRPVKFRIVDKVTGQRVAARLHVHGPHGEYLPPKGHHRKVNTEWFEDLSAEFSNGLNQYAYVDGYCTIDLPIGSVFVEITRGFEVRPLRRIVEIDETTEVVTFELENVLRWRENGWVSSDTHVHFLSPQTALLEGKAEGVNVVNLLASQWGEMFSNVGDFDGRTTLGARDFGGDGEFLVRVGTENRMQVLGHISLLGYQGDIIDPLCTGGPSEAAFGDPLEATMASWAERCRQQGGLVVMPHAPNPQAERAADIVLGLVDAIEMVTENPYGSQISAFGLADWYRYLNIGYQLPLVAGSDKMSAASLLGGIRTYAQLGGHEFTYHNWMNAVRGGDTFVTVGPLVSMTVEGRRPGSRILLPREGGDLTVEWNIESISVPPRRVEIICNGEVVEEFRYDKLSCQGHCSVRVAESCWISIRVRGSLSGHDADIAAHTSAVFVGVGDRPIFATADAVAVLAQIEGSIAYFDTLAPRSDEARHARLRAALEMAHHRLHHRLHQLGADHQHTPVHSAHKERQH